MRHIASGYLLLVLSSMTAAQDDNALLREELRDATDRQQKELLSRAQALTEQTEIAAQLLQRQQQYIEQLEAQIRALQSDQSSND